MLATDNSANSMAVALDPGTWLLTLDGRFNDGGGGGYYDASRTANVTNVGGCTVTVHFVVTGDGGHGRYMYASNIATYRFTITGQTANQTLSIGADSGQGGGSNAIAFLTKTS